MTTAPVPGPSSPPNSHPLPAEAYERMALVLRLGLGVALGILGIGVVAYLLQNPGASSSDVLSHNPILTYLHLSELVSGLAAGSVGAVLTLGLIVLVATPIARVASGLYYFQRGRERAMTGIAFIVLVLLLLGILVIGPLIR
ncbi:MAG TPA: DUF1634 domain-containing protein [Thermoplasmata archaeon]|jgi:uncharacterized membrane protein|nr:DUF1634 domain-containing protein [Thermoplasmata archaeon]